MIFEMVADGAIANAYVRTHAVFGDLFTNGSTSPFMTFWEPPKLCTRSFRKLERILGRITVPLGSPETRIGPRSLRSTNFVGIVADSLHDFVVELDGLLRGERKFLAKENFAPKNHDAKADRTVTHVRGFGRFSRVKVHGPMTLSKARTAVRMVSLNFS